MKRIEVVEVTPIEFDLDHDYIRIYRNIKVSPNLTQKKFNEIMDKIDTKEFPSIIENPNHFIIYQYPNKPMIMLDLNNNVLLTHKYVWDSYPHEFIMHQASIILRIIKKYHLANFRRSKISISTAKLGKTKKERQLTYKLIEEAIKRKYEREKEREERMNTKHSKGINILPYEYFPPVRGFFTPSYSLFRMGDIHKERIVKCSLMNIQ